MARVDRTSVTLRFTDGRSAADNPSHLSNEAATADWLFALAPRAGPLVPAARSFIRSYCPQLEAGSPTSANLLRELSRCLQRFVSLDAVDDEEDRRFVEGAGALLGLILILHVGDASHSVRGNSHRVRLRRYGFFDPFAAIERALDADQVRKALAREVSLAEAEAEGTGPIARVVGALARALSESHSDLRICEQFGESLVLQSGRDGTRIDLDLRRAIETTRDQDAAAAARVAQRYLSMLPGTSQSSESAESLRSRLLPRLVRSDVISDLSVSGQTALFSLPYVGPLSIAVVAQEKGRARYLRCSELTALRLDAASLVTLATQNLEASAGELRLKPCTDLRDVFVARTGDGRDSARLLLPMLYPTLSHKLGRHLCVGVPHRDAFFVCNAEDDDAVRALSERTAADAARAPHKLSEHTFSLEPGGLTERLPRHPRGA